jgi:hypothetical protein
MGKKIEIIGGEGFRPLNHVEAKVNELVEAVNRISLYLSFEKAGAQVERKVPRKVKKKK